jgi:hypothetical protein
MTIVLAALIAATSSVDDEPCNLRGFGWCLTIPPEAEISLLDNCITRSVHIQAEEGREVVLRQGDEILYEVRPGPGERLEHWHGTPMLSSSTPDRARYRIPVSVKRHAEDAWEDSEAFQFWMITWPREGWLGYPGVEAIGQSFQLCRAGECNGEDLPASGANEHLIQQLC